MPRVRPFRFKGLPSYTGEQVAVLQSLATYLSHEPFRPEFRESLGTLIERYLKVPCEFGSAELRTVSVKQLHAVLPSVGCLLVIGAGPTEYKIIVELDIGLAAFLIDKLLGGDGANGRIQRPLTEIEAGVLSFLLLKVLGEFHSGWSTGRELSLSLDRFASRLDDLEELLTNEQTYAMAGVSVALGSRSGYLRILIPSGLIRTSFASQIPQGPPTEKELAYMRKVLQSIGDTNLKGHVEAATLDLGPDDIASLEVGDIIILENHQIAKTAEGLAGNVFVKIGTGQNGGLRGRLINDGEQLRLQILEIVVQEQPLEGEAMVQDGDDAMAEQGAAGEAVEPDVGESDNLEQTHGLLRDAPAPVVVELGRVRLSTAQVARLRSGQILRLPRGPNDPVDLVVNGKLFARGELIEVDGELGARLLHVAGGS